MLPVASGRPLDVSLRNADNFRSSERQSLSGAVREPEEPLHIQHLDIQRISTDDKRLALRLGMDVWCEHRIGRIEFQGVVPRFSLR